MSDVILGVWNRYAVLLMLLARSTPAVAAVEAVAAAEGSAYSGGGKADPTRLRPPQGPFCS